MIIRTIFDTNSLHALYIFASFLEHHFHTSCTHQTIFRSNAIQGRSAFEPLSTSGTLGQPSVATADQVENEIERGGHRQQYDSKGNPRSLDATRRAEAQIAAKNEVLAAVGVCEKKSSRARQTVDGKVIFSDEEWKVILEAENSLGETGRIVAECCRHGCSWWLIALRKRIQVCLSPPGHSTHMLIVDPGRSYKQRIAVCADTSQRMAYNHLGRLQWSV